jgi:transposase
MRGEANPDLSFLTVINLSQRIPLDHPLRAIKPRVETVLKRLSPEFDALYAEGGRPSIPPEQLLKGKVLMALYSVRSERLFCEQLGYNLLWLWFLDRGLEEGAWDHSTFSQNQERVLSSDLAKLFLAEVYQLSREEGWTSDAHFTVDGTLVEAWASLKSFVRKDGQDAAKVQKAKDDDPGNPTIDFRGEKRCNQTHQSTTDPESVLYRKGNGRESRLCFGAHVLMENRNGLCAQITVHNPITAKEPTVAVTQLDLQAENFEEVEVSTVAADKGYHEKRFVAECRQREIAPHVACKENVRIVGLDSRTTQAAGYQTSQRIRKRVEEIFGWMKTVGGLRRTRYRGIDRTQSWAYFVAGAYNLLRMGRLAAQQAAPT